MGNLRRVRLWSYRKDVVEQLVPRQQEYSLQARKAVQVHKHGSLGKYH